MSARMPYEWRPRKPTELRRISQRLYAAAMEASDVFAVKMVLRTSEISAWVGAGPADLSIMVGGIAAVVGDT